MLIPLALIIVAVIILFKKLDRITEALNQIAQAIDDKNQGR
jgi:hypothetical protein